MRRRQKHHIIPRSRAKSYASKKIRLAGGDIIEGLNAEWNLKSVSPKSHRALHILFGNRTPNEIVEYLQRHRRKSGAISLAVFNAAKPSKTADRLKAWTILFGDNYSVKNAVWVIQNEWDLDAEGKEKWQKLEAWMRRSGDSLSPHSTPRQPKHPDR